MTLSVPRLLLQIAGTVALTTGLAAQTLPDRALADRALQSPGRGPSASPLEPARTGLAGPGAVRFVNVVPDIGPAFLVINGISYGDMLFRCAGDVTADIQPGVVEIEAKQNVGPAEITRATKQVTIKADTVSVEYLMGRLGDSSIDLVEVPTSRTRTPPPGTSLLRLVHAVPDIGPVDVEAEPQSGPKRRYDNIGFKQASSFEALDAGFFTFRVYLHGSTTPMMELSGLLPSENIVTAIATGMASNQSVGINALFEDQGAQQPMYLLPASIAAVPGSLTGPADGPLFTPNPARGSGILHLDLDRPDRLSVRMYDNLGRLAAEIPLGDRPSGRIAVPVELGDVSPGLYRGVVVGSSGETIDAATIAVGR